MAQVLPDIFDVPDAGQSGEFALCRAGGGLYFAVIANKGDGGRLFATARAARWSPTSSASSTPTARTAVAASLHP
jgi:hypothetical protein